MTAAARIEGFFLALFQAFQLSLCTMPILNPTQSKRLLERTPSHFRHFLSACVGSGCLCSPSLRIRCQRNSKLLIDLGRMAKRST
uniref:Putative secreted protein n=1 Tax=Ixodes ricinus TaxID=34613 RepID=A0A6B0U8Y7_IXORI